MVTIITSENSVSCGIVGKPADVLGIMAYVDDSGRLASNICQAVDAETVASTIFEGEPSLSIPAVTLEELTPLFVEPSDERFPDAAAPNPLGDDAAPTRTPSGARVNFATIPCTRAPDCRSGFLRPTSGR